ncbi:hypothetical protein PR729_20970 [Providencia rettgeri]|nr:hypothetical protein PR729_20970 [Providencia rettgeri]
MHLKGLQCTEFEEGGALCSSENSPQIANKLFLLMFSREKNTLMLVSSQGKDSRDQSVILAEYDAINQKMFEAYGLPKQTIERYKRDIYFLDKISDDETTPFKRVYEKMACRLWLVLLVMPIFAKFTIKKILFTQLWLSII